jgi:hypothetical protein
VPRTPSRSGSSPTHSRMVRTAPESFDNRSAACSGVASSRSRVPRPLSPVSHRDLSRKGVTVGLLTGPAESVKVDRGIGGVGARWPTGGHRSFIPRISRSLSQVRARMCQCYGSGMGLGIWPSLRLTQRGRWVTIGHSLGVPIEVDDLTSFV